MSGKLWYNVWSGQVCESAERPGPDWDFLLSRRGADWVRFFLFRRESGEYVAFHVLADDPVCSLLERFYKEGRSYEYVEKFFRFDLVASAAIYSFRDRVRAFGRPKLLAKLLSKRILEAECKCEVLSVLRCCVRLEELLGVRLLEMLDPEALLRAAMHVWGVDS